MNELPLVSILILNWNRKKETCRAIESALNQSYSNIEILVVDNGSTDGSAQLIQKCYPQINYIQLDKNYGCPGGRNKGIAYCNGYFIFFCDNDGVLHTKAVENAVNCISQDKKIAIITGIVKDFIKESEIDTEFPFQSIYTKETCSFQGGISLHRKTIYSIIGNYPDDYMYGGEETYLSYRILDAGFKIVKSDQVVLWHKQSELARNYGKESIQMWGNALMNAYQLFPIEYFLIYFFYFFSVYPFYALHRGFLKSYFKTLYSLFHRFRSYKRKPVKRRTYRMFRNMKM
jgi:GT2 family glycosyltransferase